ncbi:hypothetical protein DFP72DRAFT_898651 [Ephemerocybe angulata]|uniref:Uncharacterized protein n=1 Tax=Ephemerocybe angulata TaxID=980116 RepID=A0A8H6HXF0_9AGAR|nr:hypothetical protein DFP72DRAFT_898651 [Tulosesus angulatus]
MAFTDVIALVLLIGVAGAFVYGVMFVIKQIDAGVATTKESLKAKGLDISSKGVSLKTDKRFDREDYLDATQRGFINVIGNSSLNKYLDSDKAPPGMQRSTSGASSASEQDKKKKRGMWGSKKRVD